MGLVKPERSHRFIGPLAFSTHNPWWCPNGPVPLPLRKGKPYLDHVGKHHLGTYHLERFQPNNAGTVIMCRGRIMISDDFRTSVYYRGSRFLVPHLAFCWVGPEFCGDICCKIHKERDIPVQTFLDEKWSPDLTPKIGLLMTIFWQIVSYASPSDLKVRNALCKRNTFLRGWMSHIH